MPSMRISIDAARCTGHGRCWDTAPELFDVDDDGRGVVIREEVAPELQEKARLAVVGCPERAIDVTE
jgi:ferredoxin